MISLQTNVDSLLAQQNLNIDNQLQSATIQQLTSGYRINASGDDAAGLAVANEYRATIAQITQGVANGNDGLSTLQIVDGGLNNISLILDRLETLATQSASPTFTGSRATLNVEYQSDLAEITRQATNVNLNAGGSLNTNIGVYIGGAPTTASQTNALVNVNLSGTANAVDSTSLGLNTTNVLAGGVGFSQGTTGTANTQRLDAPGALFAVGTGTANTTFTFNLFANGVASTLTATVLGTAAGSTEAQVLAGLNTTLNTDGITASVDGNGLLQFSGSTAFTVLGASGTAVSGGVSTSGVVGSGIINAAGLDLQAENTSNYIANGQATYGTAAGETLTFHTDSGPSSVVIAAGTALTAAIADINSVTAANGLYAILNANSTGITFQSQSTFSVSSTTATGTFGAGANTAQTVAGPATGTGNNATAAITAINAAIASLGLTQGQVGAGENKLNYAINLANSQIASYSKAESQIRDADVAAAAANLSKSQVLTQTSIAALAQANAEPQAILKLLQ